MAAPMVASDLPTGISSGQVAEMIASQPPELLRFLLAPVNSPRFVLPGKSLQKKFNAQKVCNY
jgi:hypothetical protein